MAGLRQYLTLADVPFDIYTPGRTLQDEVNAGNAIIYGNGSGGTTNLATFANIAADTTPSDSDFSGGLLRFSITGANSFTNSGSGSYTIHVLQNMDLAHTGPGALAITQDGTYVVMINCTESYFDWDHNGNALWVTRCIATPTASDAAFHSYGSGTSTISRPTRPDSVTGDRMFLRYGNDIILGPPNTGSSIRFTYGETRECRVADVSGRLSVIYTIPGTTVGQTSLTGPGTEARKIFFFHGDSQGTASLIGTDTRGFAPTSLQFGRIVAEGLQGLPGGVVAGFSISVPPTLSEPGWIKNINPLSTISSTGDNTSLIYDQGTAVQRQSLRYIELVRFAPTYQEGLTTLADGISVRANVGVTFNTPDQYHLINTTSHIEDYVTGSDGRIQDTSNYIPDSGQTGAITSANGLIFPVATYGTNSNGAEPVTITDNITLLTHTVDVRSFYHSIPNGREFYTLDKAFLDNRVTNEGASFAGVVQSTVTAIDTSVSSQAIYSTGTTKRTPAELETYFYNSVTGVLSTLTTVQNISDALKFEYSKYTTNANHRVVTDGNEINYPGNITFSGTGSDLTPTFTSSGVTFGGRPAANALAPSAVTDTITQINAFTGSIRHVIDYNNFLVPTGWRFGHATHRNIQETTGGVINNAVITANAILEFERGSIYSFSNADTTAASLGSFDTMGTGSDLVRINVPAGDTGFDSIPTLNNPGNSTLRALLEASGNFEFVDVPIPTAATYQVPANLRNGFFGVKNVTQDTELVAPVAVDPNTAATYSYTINSALYTSEDIIRIYWRPTTTLQAGYSTRVFEFTATRTDLVNTVPNGTFDLASPRIAAVLWENVVGTLNIPATTTSILEFGDQDLNGVTRAEIEYADEPQALQDPTTGQPATLALTMLAANDVDYLSLMMDNNLLNDVITPGQSDTVVDSRYIYLNTINTTTQVTLTAISASGTSVPADLTPVSLQGIAGAFTVVIRINPAGATPAQIQSASLGALISFFTNNAIGRAIRRALGYLVGRRLGTKGAAGYVNDGTQDTNYLNRL